MAKSLIPVPLTERSVHLCLDMQNLFAPGGPWSTPWMPRVLPVIETLATRFPERTVFTRFITPQRPEDMPGMWQRYYQRWRVTTRECVAPDQLELVPSLRCFVPPAAVIDKTRYSAFAEAELSTHLDARRADALIVSGSETDVCILATVLDAVDLGYRVIVVEDGVCSSSDEGHDALMTLYGRRFSEQIEMAKAEEVLALWRT
jgi:nicotinamidase-related amidase